MTVNDQYILLSLKFMLNSDISQKPLKWLQSPSGSSTNLIQKFSQYTVSNRVIPLSRESTTVSHSPSSVAPLNPPGLRSLGSIFTESNTPLFPLYLFLARPYAPFMLVCPMFHIGYWLPIQQKFHQFISDPQK